ncbi:MAG: 16S rRNA (guanine(527)-N(7))-methyltransferase RsmG [Paracoccus denitrificans]|nr:MAG: 16S rRNA (guanine(527)-N(7))-methyltransferase RsmG [Paracoccus denitrificans]PZO85619.1 MAG: 16S rRNA (guanine(527)-N(7))-methyltransferase RsmG [Paracoccus denitrificans]
MIASREAALSVYIALIRKWNPAINLVSPNTLHEIADRHIADSVQLAEIAVAAGSWLDIGSGGGLPGIPLAICQPARRVTLLDSDKRKVTFLRTCIRELELTNAVAISARIEECPPANVRHVSARALAPLPTLVPYVVRHLATGGTAWLMKGQNWREEVAAVADQWKFELTVHPSRTDPAAAILELNDIRHA